MQAPRGSQQLINTSRYHDLGVDKHGNSVADLLNLVQQVAGQHNGAALCAQAPDQLGNLDHAGRVEPVRRLVEED